MKKFNLIIPSAKLVSSNMQTLGKLPSALYPIESKTVLQRLYNQYNGEFEKIYLVTYEEAKQVDEYLEREKNLKDINVVKLNELEDLGKTIFEGLKAIKQNSDNKRIIINFGDTLIFEETTKLPLDGFYYSEDIVSNTWTFFEDGSNGLEKIIDKKSLDDNNYLNIGKLFVGVFSFSDLEYLEKCLNKALKLGSYSNMDSFYEAILMYDKKYSLKAVKTNNWCDIGHLDKYYNAQLGVKAREFNHIVIDKNRGILTKTSSDKEKFIGEILWAIKLPKDLEYTCPRIFSYSTNYNNPYIAMEYYSYHTLHELLLYSDINKKQWITIFNKIKFIFDDFSRYTVNGDGIEESLKSVYLDKTIQRLNKLKENEFFKKYFTQSFYINGKCYNSLNEIIAKLKIQVPKILFNIEKFSIIHGDLCFSNILVDSNNSFVKLIDPRGNFGKFDIYGDSRYELAKILHSIDGKYDYIIEEQFDLTVDDNKMNFVIKNQHRSFDLCKEFFNIFKDVIGERKKEIELIEALLFISMIPLHNESLRQQCVMLGTGIEILDRCIDIKC